MGLADDYINLIASGDKQKIQCVLTAVGVSAGAAGIAVGVATAPANAVPVAGTAFNGAAAGVAAVVALLISLRPAIKFCGGVDRPDNLERSFSQGKVPADLVSDFEDKSASLYGISREDARILLKIAVVGFRGNQTKPSLSTASHEEIKIAIEDLIHRVKRA